MSEKIHTITICMGSSCFSRGNKTAVKFLQQYLKEKRLEDEIVLKGAHCMGDCDKGPLIKIDDEIIIYASDSSLEEKLDQKLGLK